MYYRIKTIFIGFSLLLVVMTNSCKSEKDKLLEKLDKTIQSGNNNQIYETSIEFINNHPDDTFNINNIVDRCSDVFIKNDTSSFRKFSEFIFNKSLSKISVSRSISNLFKYYGLLSHNIENISLSNKFYESVIAYYQKSSNKESDLAKILSGYNKSVLNKIEKNTQIISLASGEFENGNSFVGELYGRAAANLTTSGLSVTYDVFSPFSGQSEQYVEKGYYSDIELIEDKSNNGFNILKGTWNTDRVNNYGTFIIKIDKNRLFIIVQGSPGSNWLYQCYKEIDDYTRNMLEKLLVVDPFESEKLPNQYQPLVSKLIEKIKNGDKNSIADLIAYPFNRAFPLPSINNKKDFVKHYDEIFDDFLIQVIINSDPYLDWSEVGYRGIMLGTELPEYNGVVWMDVDGKISHVNYLTDKGVEHRQNIISEDIKKLHNSLLPIKELVSIIDTKELKLRIDLVSNDKLRLSKWKANQSMSEMPETVLENGKVEYHGAPGHPFYIFENDRYKYEIIGYYGEYSIDVYENGNKTLSTATAGYEN
jgi:hypothetical protein